MNNDKLTKLSELKYAIENQFEIRAYLYKLEMSDEFSIAVPNSSVYFSDAFFDFIFEKFPENKISVVCLQERHIFESPIYENHTPAFFESWMSIGRNVYEERRNFSSFNIKVLRRNGDQD